MLARVRTSMEEKDQGFTLIELLVVMIIIGILAAIAIPVFLNQRENGYRAALKSDLKNAAISVESFAIDNNGSYTALIVAPATELPLPSTTPAVPFNKSQGMDYVTVKKVTASTFCVEAVHGSLPSEKWRFASSEGAPKAGACP